MSAAFSPIRPVLALASRGGRIGLWDTAAGREAGSCSGQTSDVGILVFTPDGQTLVSASGQDIWAWSVADGKVRVRFEHESGVSDLAISPNGRLLAAIGTNRLLQIWDLASHELRTDVVAPGWESDPTLAFRPDGTILAIGSTDRTDYWNIEEARFEHATSQGGSVAFSPDGRLFAARNHRSLTLLDCQTKQPAKNKAANRNDLNHVVFSPDSQWLALGPLQRCVAAASPAE